MLQVFAIYVVARPGDAAVRLRGLAEEDHITTVLTQISILEASRLSTWQADTTVAISHPSMVPSLDEAIMILPVS